MFVVIGPDSRNHILPAIPPTETERFCSSSPLDHDMSEQPTDLDATIDGIVAERCGVDQTAFDESTRFDGDVLEADSLDVVEMAEAIDATLGVYIPDEDLEDLETVGDVKAYLHDAL